MKHRMGQLLGVVGLTTALLVALAVVSFAAVAQSWHFLGSPPGIVPASVNAYTNVAIDSTGTPYIAFVDATNGEKATVKKYTGGAWATVGSAGFSTPSVSKVQLAITGTTVYALYRSTGGALTVDAFNSLTWQHVVSTTINNGNGQYPSFALYGNEIFVAYKDWSNSGKLTVMHFDGTNWTPLGGSPGISSGTIYAPSIAVDSAGTVYVVYDNFSSLSMMKFTGGAWSTVSTGFTAGNNASLKIDSTGAPVVAFQDLSAGVTVFASVLRYSGGVWSSVGIEGFSGGIARLPQLVIGASNRLFVAFSDEVVGTKVSVMEFDTSLGWIYTGNRGASVGDVDTGSVSIAVRPDGIVPVIGFVDNGLGTMLAAMQLGTNVAPVATGDTASVPDSMPSTLLPLENDSDTDGDYLRVSSIITAPLHGTAAISGYTQIVYTPTTNYVGTDSLGYVVSDGALTDTATVSITVFGANNPPVGVNDPDITDEEISVTVSPLTNDTDSDGNPLSVTWVTNGKHGTASISGTTQVVYTPTTNFYGVDRLLYVVSDGSLTDTAAITVTVNPINDAPRIISSTWQALTGAGFSGGAFVNLAIDHNGTPYIAYADSSAGYDILVKKYIGGAWVAVGTAVASPGGITPLSFALSKQDVPYVAYRDTSNNLLTVKKYTGSAWVTVGAAARSSGNNNTISDMSLDFNYRDEPLVVYNDGGFYLDRFNGTAWTLDASYLYGFYPDFMLNSADVAYVAVRNPGQSNKISVFENSSGSFFPVGASGFSNGTVLHPKIVLDNNDAPFVSFIDDAYYTKTLRVMAYDGATWAQVGGDMSDNVSSADFALSNGGILTVMYVTDVPEVWVKQYINGTWTTVLSAATTTIAANLAVSPADELYVYADGGGNVAKMNAVDVVTAAVTMDEDGSPTPFSFDTNVFDADNDVLTWTITAPPANGVAVGGVTPVYTPTANYNGFDTFTAQVSDGALTDTVAVSVTIAPQDDPPVMVDDTLPVLEDVTELLDVLANDLEVDGQSLAITSVGTATHGSLSIAGGLYLHYTPDADYNGTDTFTYVASDGALTGTATVTVTVSPVNDAPVAVDDLASVAENYAVTISPLGNDNDVDGDTLSVASVFGALNGTASLSGTTQVVYTPTTGYTGSEILAYVVSDGTLTDTGSITVNITANQPPVAVDDTATTDEDIAFTISPLGNDSDPDSNPLAISAVSTPVNGAVSISGTTQLVFTPTLNFNGQEVLNYTVTDGFASAAAAITITVTAKNDTPVAMDDTATTDENLAVTVSPLENDNDVDGDTLFISAVGTPAHGTAGISGTVQLVYTPTIGYSGSDTFSYIISDGALTATASITVTVNPASAPIFYIYLPLVLK